METNVSSKMHQTPASTILRDPNMLYQNDEASKTTNIDARCMSHSETSNSTSRFHFSRRSLKNQSTTKKPDNTRVGLRKWPKNFNGFPKTKHGKTPITYRWVYKFKLIADGQVR